MENNNQDFNKEKSNEELEKVTVLDDKVLEGRAEDLCRWAAARAGVIVVAPLVGTAALLANEVYMIIKLGKVYEQKITETTAVSILGSLGTMFVGQTIATLIPFAPMQIPIAVGTTYGLGRVVTEWLKSGKPEDLSAFKTVYDEAVKDAKKNLDLFKNNSKKDDPLGDESKKFK